MIIAAQTDHAKTELMAEMKAAGVEYEERIERLSQVEAPKPNKDWIYDSFNEFRAKHPWVGSDTVKPKSIVRDMWERVMTFTEYVNHYGLKRSEGVRAALPVRRLQGPDAEHPRGRPHRRDRRPRSPGSAPSSARSTRA